MARESRLPEKVQVARLKLMREYPYLSAGLLAFVPVESEKCPTMAVDQYWRLYFNRETIDTWTEDEIAGVLWHELNHLLFEHHDRARLQNAYDLPWNVAADAEINDDLREAGVALPEGCVYPEGIIHKDTGQPMAEKLLAENYYEALDIKVVSCSCPDQDDQSQNQSGSESGQGGSGQGENEESEGQSSAGSGCNSGDETSEGGNSGEGGDKCDHQHGQNSTDGKSTDSQGQPQNPSGNGSGSSGGGQSDPNCPIHGQNPIPHGSASGMNPGEWEQQESTSDGSDPRKVGDAESEIIKRKVAQDTQDYAQKSRGTVPGFMERFAKNLLKPQVPWKQVLRGAVRRMIADVSGAVDYVRTRPSRRASVNRDVVLPALRQPTPNIAFAIDTSGSMGTKELTQGLTEVKGVLQTLGVRDMTVFAVDHAVGFAEKVTNPNKIKLIGGGGTDMGIAIAQAEQLRPRPDALIIFTDGYTPWPAMPPSRFKVIVVSTTEQKGPEWAKTIHVDLREGRR